MRWWMMVAALPLAACGSAASSKGDAVAPSGSGGERSFAVADFDRVELAGADDIDVRVGSAFSVRAEGPADQLEKLDIRKDGSTLWVGRKRENGGWSIQRGKGVTVHVTMPAIAAANLAGSGNLNVDRVTGDAFKGQLAGSGNLRLADLRAERVDVDLAGSGNVQAGGQVGRLGISIAGSGDVDAAKLRAKSADISIAGSGNVAAEVSGDAKVSVMGSGDVTLTGGARCQSSKMGSGEIRCS